MARLAAIASVGAPARAQRSATSRAAPASKLQRKPAGGGSPPGECSQTENADGFERDEEQDPVDELRVYHEGAHARSAGRLALGQ